MIEHINIKDFNYDLPEDRIAKFPLPQRDLSKLLIYRDQTISETVFNNLPEIIPNNSLLVCNNTKVIKARLIFFKSTGAKIEIFCLEPHSPADYERAFSQRDSTQWLCMVGNLKKWRSGKLTTSFLYNQEEVILSAELIQQTETYPIIEFTHNNSKYTFGEILEILGKIPIPPYLNRESCLSDEKTYQTVYSKYDGSVAAPTAGLHFTEELFKKIISKGCNIEEVTLHVGAGTFLPVKASDASSHEMHTEHFEIDIKTVEHIYDHIGKIVAVGTTSVRTLESITVLGYRAIKKGSMQQDTTIGQWEAYEIPEELSGKELLKAVIDQMKSQNTTRLKASTQIMITPQYQLKIVDILITNFHQPQSTLLLLISSIVKEQWKDIYSYALEKDFRFLSYGDSSILFR